MQNVPGADLDVANNRPSIRKDDKDSEGLFALEGEHAVITEEMERLLGQKYSNIRYTVNVRIADASGNDDTQPYYVSRELFKHILVDRQCVLRPRASLFQLSTSCWSPKDSSSPVPHHSALNNVCSSAVNGI